MRSLTGLIQKAVGLGLLTACWSCSGDITFTTGPEVVWTHPVPGATGVRTNDTIKVGFSRKMDASSITKETFRIDRDVHGTILYSGTVARFVPLDLEFSTVYTITLTTSMRDEDGLPLEEPFVWSFSTRPPPPSVLGFSPGSGRPGDTISIFGTNFSPYVSGNTVRINEFPRAGSAPILDAEPRLIIATIPYGATSGRVAVGTAGGTTVSRDSLVVIQPGEVWFPAGSGTSNALNSVEWLNGWFVAVGAGGTILTSSDGLTWIHRNSGTQSSLQGVARSEAQFVAVGTGGVILNSADGVHWAETPSQTARSLFSVHWTGSRFVAVGAHGLVLTSADGIDWNLRDSRTIEWLYDVTSTSQMIVVCGLHGTILTSTNGSYWSQIPSGSSSTLLGVAATDSRLVVVGHQGTILQSSDGELWITQSSGVVSDLGGVTYGQTPVGGRLVAVGEDATILISTEGGEWIERDAPITVDLFDVAWNDSRYVVVGSGGVVLVSR